MPALYRTVIRAAQSTASPLHGIIKFYNRRLDHSQNGSWLTRAQHGFEIKGQGEKMLVGNNRQITR